MSRCHRPKTALRSLPKATGTICLLPSPTERRGASRNSPQWVAGIGGIPGGFFLYGLVMKKTPLPAWWGSDVLYRLCWVGSLCVLHLVHDSLESGGIVYGEVCENLAVDLDTCLVDKTHQARVGEILQTGSGIDALNPESAEVALFVLAVAVGVGQTFFPSVLGNGPDVTARAIVAAGEFEDFLSFCS